MEISLEKAREAEKSCQLTSFSSFLSQLETDFEIDEVSVMDFNR